TTGYMISTQQYATYFPEPQTFIILLRMASDVSHRAGMAALDHDLAAFPTLKGYDQASFLALQSQGLDQLTSAIDVFLVMAMVIGLVAAILPARRAARLNVLEAISTE